MLFLVRQKILQQQLDLSGHNANTYSNDAFIHLINADFPANGQMDRRTRYAHGRTDRRTDWTDGRSRTAVKLDDEGVEEAGCCPFEKRRKFILFADREGAAQSHNSTRRSEKFILLYVCMHVCVCACVFVSVAGPGDSGAYSAPLRAAKARPVLPFFG